MRTYRPYEIGRALGVNSRRITSAVDRGLLPGDRGNGSGHHREFTRDAIMHFALMCRLVDLGLTPSRASVIAGKHHGAEGVLMVTASGTDVQSQDKIIDIPHNVLLVDLALLADEVDEKLRAVA